MQGVKIHHTKMINISKPFIGEEEKKAILSVLDSGMIAQGPRVQELEQKFAGYCGTKHSVAFNSGTAALHTGLHVMGIGKGDEVITTPFSFIATANIILMQQAKPIFADIDEQTFNIDPASVQEKITAKTKAIITVDIYGQLCDYDNILKISRDKGILILEDSCQSVGAQYNGKMSGSFGDIGAFSFYATKNITCGEGGAIVTDNKSFAEKSKLFRQHGMSLIGAYDYDEIGYNYRMTDISAAFLLEQFKKIDRITEKRMKNAEYLSEQLSKIAGIEVPFVRKGNKHVFHQYTIKVKGFKMSRDKLAERLKSKGVGCNVYYPKPLHLCENFRKLGYKEGDFPVAEKISQQVLSLPVHPSLTQQELDFIIKTIKQI